MIEQFAAADHLRLNRRGKFYGRIKRNVSHDFTFPSDDSRLLALAGGPANPLSPDFFPTCSTAATAARGPIRYSRTVSLFGIGRALVCLREGLARSTLIPSILASFCLMNRPFGDSVPQLARFHVAFRLF
jgi:hypothetical protein